MDAAFLEALSQAQAAAARLVNDAHRRLTAGMTVKDIRALLEQLAGDQSVRLLTPPLVRIGIDEAGRSALLPGTERLEGATLVTLDVRPVVDGAAGDYARTVRFGDNGRMWFYQRIADKIYATFVEQLKGCRTERDAYNVAWNAAHRNGGRLLRPEGTLGHRLGTPPGNPLLVQVLSRAEMLQHRLRARVPFGIASPKLSGAWSLEPLIELDRHQYLYEDVFEFRDGEVRLLAPAGAMMSAG